MEDELDGDFAFPPEGELLDAVKETNGILSIILKSKEEGKSIAISCPLLGANFFVTAVEDVFLEDGETIVKIKPYDSTGFFLPQYKIKLSQIVAVSPFNSPFRNPLLRNFRRPKNLLG